MPSEPADRRPVRGVHALLALAASVGLMLGVMCGLGALLALSGRRDGAAALPFWLSALLNQIPLAAGPLLIVALCRLSPREALSLRRPDAALAGLTVAGAAALHVLIRAASGPLLHLLRLMDLDMDERMQELVRVVSAEFERAPVLLGLIVIVAPAICEEALFRGVALSGFRASLGPRAAVLLSAFLFSLIHLLPFRIVVTFVLGLYLGYVVVRTGSILAGALAHAVHNALSLLIPESVPMGWWAVVPAAALMAATLGAFVRLQGRGGAGGGGRLA